jgi:purine nucleosidase
MNESTETSRPCIVSVDTGVDDALALLLASRLDRSRVVAVTVSGGNVTRDEALRNTRAVLALAGWDVPVFSGATTPISRDSYVYAYDYHGGNGLCDVGLPEGAEASPEPAAEAIVRISRELGVIDFVCLDAPTNLAQALELDPSLAGRLGRVVMMGGAVDVPGNQTAHAEFNFFQDPGAVARVFGCGAPIFLVPLDVTNACFVDEADVAPLAGEGAIGAFLAEAVRNWYGFFGRPKERRFELYDPLALGWALDGQFLEFERAPLGVVESGDEAGRIVRGGPFNISFAKRVDAAGFVRFFFQTIFSGYGRR